MPDTNAANAPPNSPDQAPQRSTLRAAIIGNPNTGKTTLFNRLCGLRHKTGNFPGTTQEARVGVVGNSGTRTELIDLPGIYSLELDQSEAEVCRRVLAGALAAPGHAAREPDAVCVVIDAANLERNLILVGEVLRRRLPTVVALNMIDLARKAGLDVEPAALAQQLGCDVIACSGRSGEGAQLLVGALPAARIPNTSPPGTQAGLEAWASDAVSLAVAATHKQRGRRAAGDAALALRARTDAIDNVVTHPVTGLATFALVMFALFWAIFSLAQIPMGLIEAVFGWLTSATRSALPDGILSDFLTGGVIAGIGGVVVFLPQIVLLFFLISLLEDTGYLSRAAFLVDRFLRPFGLSGYAFVPLLSSHACALPGIIACRAIPDKKERLATILVAPFMSCSARIPVYVLLTTLLFPSSPARQALAFIACYALGAAAGLLSAMIARRTILPGKGRPMAMELPTYKRPALLNALLTAWDRALVFLKNAGTNILAISIVLWWLSAYPHLKTPPAEASSLRQQAAALIDQQALGAHEADVAGNPRPIGELIAQKNQEADFMEARAQVAQSFAGRLGRSVQPVFAPLGFDWQLSVGVVTSFAAREVFASTMGIITTGNQDTQDAGVIRRIGAATRADGVTPVFTPAVSWSLLAYFVLAMQCLPTLVLTAREGGGWKWAALQFAWMSGLAYAAALLIYQLHA
ncbi:MAG: ferrous iron transporter B [Phycisphaerales bacterium]